MCLSVIRYNLGSSHQCHQVSSPFIDILLFSRAWLGDNGVEADCTPVNGDGVPRKLVNAPRVGSTGKTSRRGRKTPTRGWKQFRTCWWFRLLKDPRVPSVCTQTQREPDERHAEGQRKSIEDGQHKTQRIKAIITFRLRKTQRNPHPFIPAPPKPLPNLPAPTTTMPHRSPPFSPSSQCASKKRGGEGTGVQRIWRGPFLQLPTGLSFG